MFDSTEDISCAIFMQSNVLQWKLMDFKTNSNKHKQTIVSLCVCVLLFVYDFSIIASVSLDKITYDPNTKLPEPLAGLYVSILA